MIELILNALLSRGERSVNVNCDGRWKIGVSLHPWDEVGISDVETKGRTQMPVKTKWEWSTGQVHLTTFWDAEGILLEEYVEGAGQTVNQEISDGQ